MNTFFCKAVEALRVTQWEKPNDSVSLPQWNIRAYEMR